MLITSALLVGASVAPAAAAASMFRHVGLRFVHENEWSRLLRDQMKLKTGPAQPTSHSYARFDSFFIHRQRRQSCRYKHGAPWTKMNAIAPIIARTTSRTVASKRIAAPLTMSTASTAPGPVAETITNKLTAAFSPIHLEVRNESHMHNVPANSETHFKVIIASAEFDAAKCKTPLARHRAVNTVLAEEVASDGPVHALSIVAKTPAQWEKMIQEGKVDAIGPSPNCRGGDGSLPKRK